MTAAETLKAANDRRALDYAARISEALAKLGDGCPDGWRQAAEARIAAPLAPWRSIGDPLGITGEAARLRARRLILAARGERDGRPQRRLSREARGLGADGRRLRCGYLPSAIGHKAKCRDGEA